MAAIALILTISSFFLNVIVFSNGAPISVDVTNLLKFRDTINDNNGMLTNWSLSRSPCFGDNNNWIGIICSEAGSIWGLKLDSMGLSGSINVDPLVKLSKLRSISFINNSFDGTMPNFTRLVYLQSIILSYNNFEGIIDSNAFEGMNHLRKIHLSSNKFDGHIPKSLSSLENLEELRLDGNQFQGVIPNVKTESMQIFNVSNNQLNGHIPSSLDKFDSSVFAGNKGLCGFPLNNTCAPPSNNTNISASSEKPTPQQQSASEKPIPLVAILSGVFVIMVLAILIFLMIRNNNAENQKDNGPSRKKMRNVGSLETGSHRGTVSKSRDKNKGNMENEKMTFLQGNKSKKFELSDLLKAGAEILGSGSFGSSYKATLNNGNVVVVKRFKQMNNVSREVFHDHMRRLGMLSHPNLLPLVAYYYRKEEKLFISDPYQKGSLGNLLHGRQVKGKTIILDWATRLKVIKGVSQGLLELYKELPTLVAPHGHLKSSNVLLTKSFEPVLSDYGLIPLINQESAQALMVAYKSPEYYNHNRITKKTDVWALGILILETLTAKFPAGYLQQGKEVDMTGWVESVAHGGFDKNIIGQSSKSNCEGEMQKLLSIGIACCEVNVEKRLDIKEVCEQIEDVKEKVNVDDDYYSTCASSTEVDFRSTRGTSDEITVVID